MRDDRDFCNGSDARFTSFAVSRCNERSASLPSKALSIKRASPIKDAELLPKTWSQPPLSSSLKAAATTAPSQRCLWEFVSHKSAAIGRFTSALYRLARNSLDGAIPLVPTMTRLGVIGSMLRIKRLAYSDLWRQFPWLQSVVFLGSSVVLYANRLVIR